MSTLKVNNIQNASGTDAISIGSDGSLSYPNIGRRNLVINGAMQVAQRGTSFTGYNIYTLDRWRTSVDVVPTQTISQEQQTDGTYVLLVNMTNGGISQVQQRIERGCNILSGKQVTFSYDIWGSGNIDVIAGDNASGANIHSESITVPSTRTRQSVTFTVPTQTSATDNMLRVGFGCRPTTNVRITNVQLEVGSVATPFEHRSYGEELALCQRYYFRNINSEVTGGANCRHYLGYADTSTNAIFPIRYPVRMRAIPTLSYSGTWNCESSSSSNVTSISIGGATTYVGTVNTISGAMSTKGYAVGLRSNDTSAYIDFDAEL